MAEPHDATPNGPLAEGAARFERIARIVKDNQLARTKSGVRPPVTEAFVLSPEEAWAKKYMTHCIGPVCYGPLTDVPPFASFAAAPLPETAKTQGYAPARPAVAAAPAAAPAMPQISGPIGVAIGKPIGNKSWLGRMFRGR